VGYGKIKWKCSLCGKVRGKRDLVKAGWSIVRGFAVCRECFRGVK
jgi:ribosomal protein S14